MAPADGSPDQSDLTSIQCDRRGQCRHVLHAGLVTARAGAQAATSRLIRLAVGDGLDGLLEGNAGPPAVVRSPQAMRRALCGGRSRWIALPGTSQFEAQANLTASVGHACKHAVAAIGHPHEPRDTELQNYVAGVPSPPEVVDLASEIKRWPMLLNGRLGCCTISGIGHQVEAWTMLACEHEARITNSAVEAYYSAVSGYVPGDEAPTSVPTSRTSSSSGSGSDSTATRSTPSVKHRCRKTHILRAPFKQGLWLFGGLYLGLDLPLTAQTQIDKGEAWDVGTGTPDAEPDSWGGHAVVILQVVPQGH